MAKHVVVRRPTEDKALSRFESEVVFGKLVVKPKRRKILRLKYPLVGWKIA